MNDNYVIGLSDQPVSEDFAPCKSQCGECYLHEGEKCDICGAAGPSSVRQRVQEALRGVDASEAVRFDPVISDDFKRAPVTQSDYDRGVKDGYKLGYAQAEDDMHGRNDE